MVGEGSFVCFFTWSWYFLLFFKPTKKLLRTGSILFRQRWPEWLGFLFQAAIARRKRKGGFPGIVTNLMLQGSLNFTLLFFSFYSFLLYPIRKDSYNPIRFSGLSFAFLPTTHYPTNPCSLCIAALYHRYQKSRSLPCISHIVICIPLQLEADQFGCAPDYSLPSWLSRQCTHGHGRKPPYAKISLDESGYLILYQGQLTMSTEITGCVVFS